MRVVQPVKRQWEAITYMPKDMAYAGTYGPLLAEKRTRFLETYHTAWDIIGKWLVGMVDRDVQWLFPLKCLIESGIFFTSDLMVEVILPSLKTLSRWSSSWGYIIGRAPTTVWLLHVKPHITVLQGMLLKFFGRRRSYDENDEGRGSLIYLVDYMTQAEQDTYSLSLCLMMNRLHVSNDFDDDYCFNLALRVIRRLNRMPEGCEDSVVRYIFGDDYDSDTIADSDVDDDERYEGLRRQHLGIGVLHDVCTPETLHRLMARISERCFRDMILDNTNSSCYYMYNEMRNSLLNLLAKARRSLSEAMLREMASNVDWWCCYDFEEDNREQFAVLCQVSVGERWQGNLYCWQRRTSKRGNETSGV